MRHTNFQGHRPFGSREDFYMFLPYMGMAAILSRDLDRLIKLSFSHPMEAPHKIWFQSDKQFLKKKKEF